MEKNPTYLFVTAAALIDRNGRILVQERPEGKPMAGLWEFPGGKVEKGETPETALVRELNEELRIIVKEQDLQPLAFASEPLEKKHLLLLLYICRKWEGHVESPESLNLRWLPLVDIHDLTMPPADGPLVQMLSNHLEARA